MRSVMSAGVIVVAVAQGPAFLQQRSNEGVVVCGEPRDAPNGEIPVDVIPADYGLLMKANQGADPDRYQDICFGDFNASGNVKAPGFGEFSNFAVTQCDNSTGCIIYRVFDTLPDPSARAASTCGHYWSPPSVLQDKSLSAYFEDVGVCTYKYAHGDTDGQKGGYLQRCTMPYGYAFVVGQTQSVLCEAEDAPNYTLGPTPALQVNIGSAYGWPCEYCKMKEVDGAYPDVLDCDGEWTSIDCPPH